MLTPRGWWILAIVLGMLLVAVSFSAMSLILVSGTLAVWFLATWIRFAWITRHVPRRFAVKRGLLAGGAPIKVLWARQGATVRAELTWGGSSPLPFVLAIDRVPVLASWQEDEPWIGAALAPGAALTVEYRLRCPSAGRLRFDGLKVIVADLQGFFYRTAFVRDRVSYRVLPPLTEGPDAPPLKKRHNLLPLLGTHRLLRPGTGSELLDLRDYVPSDPPKLIAWKVSAKRDRLITRELESEVPLRSTLLLDVSSSVRVGPAGGNALARLVEIAAAILYANAESRDLTGLVLLDELGIGKVMRPARGRRPFFEMLHLLADVADLPPAAERADLPRLLPLAMGLAQDLYPEWLQAEVNTIPWFSPPMWHQENRWRKKIAAILAHVYRLGPGGISLLYHDSGACQRLLVRWLAEHRVAYPVRLYDTAGRYQYRFPHKVNLLARALLDGVTRGKDNELFIILADLIDLETDLGPLARAMKVARARHHQVHVICPWPTGVPLPGERPPPLPPGQPPLQDLLNRAWVDRLQPAFLSLRRTLARLGVAVLPAADEQSVPQILQRLERLRAAARR